MIELSDEQLVAIILFCASFLVAVALGILLVWMAKSPEGFIP